MGSFKFLGLTFNIANVISITVTFVIMALILIIFSRNLKERPKGLQNALEWLIDFTNGIVKDQLSGDEGSRLGLYAFTLFVFIFISNHLGLFIEISAHGVDYVHSPTASPIITFTMAMITLAFAHYLGVKQKGYKKYLSDNYLKPFIAMLPINIIDEFTNLLTLALRLYGNIYAGEVLVELLAKMAFSHGWITIAVSLPLEMIWQGFSVFIGAIQAYVFVTLSVVYVSQKMLPEE